MAKKPTERWRVYRVKYPSGHVEYQAMSFRWWNTYGSGGGPEMAMFNPHAMVWARDIMARSAAGAISKVKRTVPLSKWKELFRWE